MLRVSTECSGGVFIHFHLDIIHDCYSCGYILYFSFAQIYPWLDVQAAILAIESSQQLADDANTSYLPPNSTTLDSLLSNEGVIKLLIWLYAPVAYENSKHPQLLYSDPREAVSFLERIRNKLSSTSIGHSVNIDETEDLMKWAYAEIDVLQRQDNGQKLQALSEGLASGASTLGDIVGIIEEW